MLTKVKDFLSKYKVQVTVVGGILVVATAFGTCSFDPSQASDASDAQEVHEATEVTAVSTTTEGTTTTDVVE